jgi:hypothetical protein
MGVPRAGSANLEGKDLENISLGSTGKIGVTTRDKMIVSNRIT